MGRVTVLLALAGLGLPSGRVVAQGPASAAEVLSRAIAALGGRSNLRAVTTESARGKVEVFGGFLGTYQHWVAAPNRSRAVWDLGFYRQERGFDGAAGWERVAGNRELVGRDLERLSRSSILFPLLRHVEKGTPAALRGTVQVGDRTALVVELAPRAGPRETIYLDSRSYLPIKDVIAAEFEEGVVDVTRWYDDYRPVGAIRLPFHLRLEAPDLYYTVTIDDYRINQPLADTLFVSPISRHAGEPYQLSLATIPLRVYREPDGTVDFDDVRSWGTVFAATESWTFDLLVNERYGRFVEPRAAEIAFYSGDTLVRRQSMLRPELDRLRALPATRFGNRPEIYHFRHAFTVLAKPAIDRLVYRLEAATASGEMVIDSLTISVSVYQQRNRLIFPIKGKFIVPNGHEFYELQHKYEWSQQFAYDVIGLGPNFELARNDGAAPSDYFTLGRELLAPAAGTVVYARNDIPDDAPRSVFQRLPDPMWSFAGNSVLIDHGQGEYSFLCHIRYGSVRVKVGDRVRQGEVLGLLGYSATGIPHVHYQLQAGPEILKHDGLPSRFDNTYPLGFDGTGRQVPVVKRGVYMEAR